MPATQQQFARLHEAAQFALDCCEPPFKVFLHECRGLGFPLQDDQAVAGVLQLLDVRSRDEIRTNETVAEEWRALRAEFQEWRIS